MRGFTGHVSTITDNKQLDITNFNLGTNWFILSTTLHEHSLVRQNPLTHPVQGKEIY